MEALFQTEETAKILRYLQFRIAQKFSAGESILTLLPYENSNADVAACLYFLEHTDISMTPISISPKHLYH